MPKKKTFEDYLPGLQCVHGDKLSFQGLTGLRTSSGKPLVRCVCPSHGEFEASVPFLLGGGGCAKCWAARRVGATRLSYGEWLSKFKAVHGDTYVYSGVSYRESSAVVEYFCEHHGDIEQNAQAHLRGLGCPKCSKGSAGARRRTTESAWFTKFRAAHGDSYAYLQIQYPPAGSGEALVTYTCPQHGQVQQSARNHANGHGCPHCGAASSASARTLGLDEWTPRFKEAHAERYEYLEMLRDKGKPAQVLYRCPSHGHTMQVAADHAAGHGCQACGPAGTFGNRYTREIAEYMESLGLETRSEHSFPGSRKRWDVVVPEARLAIEFDGIYFHSEKFSSNRGYMKGKADEAASNGFRQINIWEDEWYNKNGIVKRLLASAAGKLSDRKVFGRKLKTTRISHSAAKTFMEANHIQGFAPGSHYIALTESDEVVACMVYSYRAGGRDTKITDCCVEIQRYATSVSVVGGFQKLLKFLLCDTSIRSVVSYSDPRIFTGNMYLQAGFTKHQEGSPDYCYVKSRVRVSKRSRQKSWFKAHPEALYDPTLTESELATLNGYHRLWFRGKVKWSLAVPETESAQR